MDGPRFDSLAKALAGRLSRRHALRRAGAAASASLLTAGGFHPGVATALARAQSDGQPFYTMIRRYSLDTPTGQVRKALQQGYVDDACNADGFIAYFTVEDEDGDFATVAIFRSQDDLQKFATAEANWIAQNLGNLLPAPDEAISGDTYIHALTSQNVPNSCPAAPSPTPAPTSAAPTNAPPTATAVPVTPTPTSTPGCRDQGCVCATGTRNPCKGDLVCCPTTDLLGGPGICQPESVCHPNPCPANGDPCPDTCSANEACPGCCSGYCNASLVCDDEPPPCTSENCACDVSDPNVCAAGLTCCAVQGGYICISSAQCGPTPCTAQGCDCNGGVQNACDDGLVCCQEGQSIPGGPGTCQPEDQCAPPPCTGAGCACNGGVLNTCDAGLICCQDGQPIAGGAGTCVAESDCAPPPCTGQGCDCNGGVQGACDDGLICCQADGSVPGGPGTCQPADSCGPPPCIDNGAGCDATCNWGDSCSGCCSGYCNDTGQCADAAPPPCTGEGCDCITGTESPCDDGLICCASSDLPGGPGLCQASC